MSYFDSDFGLQLPQENDYFNNGFFDVDLFRRALRTERSDLHKRFNQIIKEIFSEKEVQKCVDVDEADA